MDAMKVEERSVGSIDALIGEVRRFGPEGPPYEVVGPTKSSDGGELLVSIHIIETGEDVDYPLHDLLQDPLAD